MFFSFCFFKEKIVYLPQTIFRIMLDREKVISQAFHDCMKEMYAKAQPSVDYDQLVADFKSGKITEGPNDHIYDRYYLSSEEFSYILDKYVKAYNIEGKWNRYMEILQEYVSNGGSKDVYKPDYTDKDGEWHPGHRDYEKVLPMKKQLENYFKLVLGEDNPDVSIYVKDLSDMVDNIIADCKNFYSFEREESSFRCGIALGASPTSNPDKVIEYWKKQGVDVQIEKRNPMLLWDMDYYGDEFEEVMIEEYGEEWERETWDIYHESERVKKEKREKELEEIYKKRPDLKPKDDGKE